MNSFLELYPDADYRIANRAYHAGTWEYVRTPSDALIPFQWTGPSDVDYTVTMIDVDGAETVKTTKFYEYSNRITGWTLTGTGTWTLSGPTFAANTADNGDYITSNEFSLTANRTMRVYIDTSAFTDLGEWKLEIERDGAPVYTKDGWVGWDGYAYYTPTVTDTDYTLVITARDTELVVTTTSAPTRHSMFYNSGTRHWYIGDTLTVPVFDSVMRLKIAHGSATMYTDWIEPTGIAGMTKIKVSSTVDYGGKKYSEGFAQWMYKTATVRRSPRAEIEITGDKLNGEIIEEKKVSAVRYTLKMKCTEAEFEALVHAISGTLEITDKDGKVYDAKNVELSDPAMYRTNGIVELSFIDKNNINVWTRNNVAL